MEKTRVLIFIICIATFLSCNSTIQSDKKMSESKVTLSMKVEGMTCTNCEETIQKNVSALAGVDSVKASYLDSITFIIVDTSQSNIKIISDAIESKGYNVLRVNIN
jgi:copper chaperone CopZ